MPLCDSFVFAASLVFASSQSTWATTQTVRCLMACLTIASCTRAARSVRRRWLHHDRAPDAQCRSQCIIYLCLSILVFSFKTTRYLFILIIILLKSPPDGAIKLNHGLCDIAVNWSGGLHHAKKVRTVHCNHSVMLIIFLVDLAFIHLPSFARLVSLASSPPVRVVGILLRQ